MNKLIRNVFIPLVLNFCFTGIIGMKNNLMGEHMASSQKEKVVDQLFIPMDINRERQGTLSGKHNKPKKCKQLEYSEDSSPLLKSIPNTSVAELNKMSSQILSNYNRVMKTDNNSQILQVQKQKTKRKTGKTNKTNKSMDFSFNVKIEKDRIVAFLVNIFLAVSGLYVALFGFRVFRLLMIILGFYVSYYLILFFMTELQAYNAKSLIHQIGLLATALVLGLIIAIICYMLERVNFIIFGTAIASVVSLFYVQFFVDFTDPNDKMMLLYIYIFSCLIFITSSFFVLDQTIIWGSALVGSIIFVINVGVIFGDFKSFEDRVVLPKDAWSDFIHYIIALGVVFVIGTSCQYYIRSRIIKRFHESHDLILADL